MCVSNVRCSLKTTKGVCFCFFFMEKGRGLVHLVLVQTKRHEQRLHTGTERSQCTCTVFDSRHEPTRISLAMLLHDISYHEIERMSGR